MTFGRRLAAGAATVGLAATLVASWQAPAQAPTWAFAAPGLPAVTPTPTLAQPREPVTGASLTPSPDPVDIGDDGDDGIDPTALSLTPQDGRVQVYADRPSVLPGEALVLHASTDAHSFSLTVQRETAGGTATVFRHTGYPGHDYRSRKTTDTVMHTVRANWPVAVRIPTSGWAPGVYTVYAADSSGRTSGTVFAIRTARPSRGQALFVLPVLDYQAYNTWGGFDFYSTPRAYQVSFDRPYRQNGGLSYFTAYDRWTLRWLLHHGYPLAFTTDYDLSLAPPATAPRVLVLAQHTEYVARPLYDWVDQHVNVVGDMNVASFGANSFYWQVRLVPGAHGSTLDELAYKSCVIDPATAGDPGLTTCRWRSAPVNRPESGLFGSMYSGVVDGGHTRHDEHVAATAPWWALAGTGWHAGTVLRGVLTGEADNASATDSGVAVIAKGSAPYLGTGATLSATMSARTSPAGARVFDAGTFLLGPAVAGRVSIGVSASSADRFGRNVMGWLGLTAPR